MGLKKELMIDHAAQHITTRYRNVYRYNNAYFGPRIKKRPTSEFAE